MRYRERAIRTVKNDTIRLNGIRWVSESRLPPNGRFDGRRYAFHQYFFSDQHIMPLVCLWGSEEAARVCAKSATDEEWEAWVEDESERLTKTADGELAWYWWTPGACRETKRRITNAGGTAFVHLFPDAS
jgi:hypothetical protein